MNISVLQMMMEKFWQNKEPANAGFLISQKDD